MEKPSKTELEKLYLIDKLTLQLIAEKFSTTKTSVFRWMKKYNIPAPDHKTIQPPERELLRDLYEVQKKDTSDIARQFNVNRVTVGKWLKNYGIKTRQIFDPKPIPPKEELEHLYIRMQKTMKDIGEIYGVNRSLVGKWLEQYNMEVLPRDVSKQELEYYYLEHKMTTRQLGTLYGVSRQTISRWLVANDIPVRSNQRKFYHLRAVPLTPRQREFIIGTMLGDGHLYRSGKSKASVRLTMTHCEKQLDYLLWKKEVMGNFVNSVCCYEEKKRNSVSFRWASIVHNELNFFHKLFYDNNKKVVREDIVRMLTPLSMAVWVMDDGWKNHNCNIRISSESFSKEENEILQRAIKINFDINCKVMEYKRNNKSYYTLSFNKRNSILLTNLIEPYIHRTMRYKLIQTDCSPTTTCETPINSAEDIV